MRRIAPLLLALGLAAGVGAADAGRGHDAVRVGEAVTVKFQVVGEGASEYGVPTMIQARLTLLEVLRGTTAWERLRAAGEGNAPPAAGFEYLLVRVRIAGESSGTMRIPYQVQAAHFRIFDAAGRPCPNPTVHLAEPSLTGVRIYPDDIREGWLAFLIAKDDRRPELFFFGGQWFQTG